MVIYCINNLKNGHLLKNNLQNGYIWITISQHYHLYIHMLDYLGFKILK